MHVGKRSNSGEVLAGVEPNRQQDAEGSGVVTISSLTAADDFDDPFLVQVKFGDKTADALVDSGCSIIGVIDYRLLKHIDAEPLALAHPRPIRDFKGRSAPPIVKKVVLPMQVNNHWEPMAVFYITDLGSPTIILGRPWLRRHGVKVDFANSQISFGKCDHDMQPNTPRRCQAPQPQQAEETPFVPVAGTVKILQRPQRQRIIDPDLDRSGNRLESTKRVAHKESQSRVATDAVDWPKQSKEAENVKRVGHPEYKQASKGAAQEKSATEKRKERRHRQYDKEARIHAIGAAPFQLLANKHHHQVFAISMKDITDELNKRKEAENAAANLDELIPPEFHEFKSVFDRQAAKELSPHRTWDHKIELLEGSKLPRTEQLRRMVPEELEVLKEWLEENLEKGWITPSSFEFASPILFVRKPNGGLRVCVDYRKLNEITKKSKYPLPLITETIARVCKAKIFSKFDIIAAFNRLRMHQDSENLTTFATRYGTYKFRVMPFGLCGGPGSYQQWMNDNFMDLADFMSIYLDDILVFSKNRKEHTQHVQQVLQRLKELGIEADILKSEFYVTRTKYLGVILDAEDSSLQMDPAKVKVVKEWPKPVKGENKAAGSAADIRGVRQFIGFIGFYRRFIKNFAKLARPLYNLFKNDSLGLWTEACDASFQQLKNEVSSDTVMRHFDPGLPTVVECDSSDHSVGGILSQMVDGAARPVAFFSTTMAPAERNYAIYDKELLAVIRCFEEWRPELLSAEDTVKVLTDHKALEYFMTTKQLTRRQARWAEFLSQFRFQVTYRAGLANEKADMLTRLPNNAIPRSKADPHLQQTLLPPKNVSPELREHLAIRAISTATPMIEQIRKANKEDNAFDEIRAHISAKKNAATLYGWKTQDCTSEDEVLYYKRKLAVPLSVTVRVLDTIHAGKETGHPGLFKMLALLKQNDLGIPKAVVAKYLKNCHICNKVKVVKQLPEGPLQPLAIPEKPWNDISIDFVTGLKDDDAILVVIDRLSKERHYIESKKTATAEDTAKLMIEFVWKYHGLPSTIISDRGPQFVSQLWKHWCQRLGVKAKLSTAYHPETDGQTENANAFMEQYLKAFVDHFQDNYKELLPMAEFSANALVNESTKLSPFMMSRGMQPRMSFQEPTPEMAGPARLRIQQKRANEIADQMEKVWNFAKQHLAAAQERMKKNADRSRRPISIAVGDLVWLNMKNLKTDRPLPKLDNRFEGPFEVLEQKGSAFRLKLPPSMECHDTFHVSLLKKADNDPLPGQEFSEPGPIIVAPDEQEPEWEVDQVLDVKRSRGTALKVKCRWVGYPDDVTWHPINNFMNCKELLQEFYIKHPNKPRPSWLPNTSADPTTTNHTDAIGVFEIDDNNIEYSAVEDDCALERGVV